MSEYISSESAKMYIGVKFVERKDTIKYVLVLIVFFFFNVKLKARFFLSLLTTLT